MDTQTGPLPPWGHLSLPHAIEFYRDSLAQAYRSPLPDGGIAGELGFNAIMARIASQDLFFLLTDVLNRKDMDHPWIYERCREVQAEPDGFLDLWARYHYKSTIITFGLTIKDIIEDPEVTFGFFSHTRPIAKQFLRQIMQEMENNPKLPLLWPNIFWEKPRSQAPKWSEDDGIIVKRKSNPKECTIEAWGLVDGQPVSKHFKKMVYDDLVSPESVTTPEQIAKTTKGWELSSNLGTMEGSPKRYAGTRYHLFDSYADIQKRGAAKPRVHPATLNGREDGEPVLMSRKKLADERINQGPYTFAAQMLLNPVADKVMGFKEEWLKYAVVDRTNAKRELNRYLICDPASEKRAKARKDPDYTSMWVIGVGAAKHYYLLDGIRDRLSLTGRAKALIGLHRKWQPMATGYEEYGMQADIEYIKTKQEDELYQFPITPLGGSIPKNDRIKRLIPVFEGGRFFIPKTLLYKDHTGATVDLVRVFREEEYLSFPVLAHDDMLDCLARILDVELSLVWPDPEQPVEAQGFDYHEIEEARAGPDWTVA